MLANRASLADIGQVLRHARPKTTFVYTKIDVRALRALETTQVYLDADLAMKEKALAKVQPMGEKLRRYKPEDDLVAFLKAL